MVETIPSFYNKINSTVNIDTVLNTKYDEYSHIPNLSITGDKKTLCKSYIKSIISGTNHIFVSDILKQFGPSTNISLPLIHKWEDKIKISNIVIISHPGDAERIAKKHIKKPPVFKSLVYDSIISTTNNDDWALQRNNMNIAFLPNTSLSNIFHISQSRAHKTTDLLKKNSANFTQSINIGNFLLNETQAHLQLSLFGFSDEFQEKTNKKVRDALVGISPEYLHQYTKEALQETIISDGPLSKLFKNNDSLEKKIGNMLLFTFAGHDTTGHTMTWLIYELCKHPHHKRKLIEEIDRYWLNNKTETYDTFNQLPFMTRCITEILRLWPAFANGTYREFEKDDEITGINGDKVKISKGTYCQIMNWTRHRNPELWGDDADTFNPCRKYKSSEIWDDNAFGFYNTSSQRYSPFTYSPRNCLGKNFAHMEIRLILLNMFKECDFQLTSKQNTTIHDTNYMGFNTITLAPKSIYNTELLGMYVNIFSRKSNL